MIKDREYFVNERRSNFQIQVETDYPYIAQNLGDQRILLINKEMKKKKKVHILELDPNEKFVTFVQFNRYNDIGFYPKGLNIDCCARFYFITTKRYKTPDDIDTSNFNLLLLDPYHPNV